MSSQGVNEIAVRIGVAERVITPELGVEMAGFAARKGVAAGVHDDLHARALVVEGPDETVGILVGSVIGFGQELVDRIRAAVAEQTGLDGDRILIAATHTHSGPKVEGDYAPFLEDRCVECLTEAWNARRPGRLGIGPAQVSDVGRNRRRLEYGGLPVDPEIGIIKAEDDAGRTVGVFFSYACHATTLGPDSLLISEDFPHYAIRTVKEGVGESVIVAFLNGAEGDINPGYNSGLSAVGAPIPIRNFPFAEKIGTRLGHAVLDALPGIPTQDRLPVRSLTQKVDLPSRTTFPVAVDEAEDRARAAEKALKAVKADAETSCVQEHRAEVDLFFAQMVSDRANQFHSEAWEDTIPVEVQSIRLGDGVLTSFPGEVFVEIGLEAKKRSPFRKTLIVGLANGRSGGYLPTSETYNEGDYEVVAARYSQDAGDVLIEQTVKQLEALV